MSEQDLNCSRIAGRLVDQCSLCASECVRAVVFASQPNCSDSLIAQFGILASAEMISMIDPTRKGVVIDCSASPFKQRKQTCPAIMKAGVWFRRGRLAMLSPVSGI